MKKWIIGIGSGGAIAAGSVFLTWIVPPLFYIIILPIGFVVFFIQALVENRTEITLWKIVKIIFVLYFAGVVVLFFIQMVFNNTDNMPLWKIILFSAISLIPLLWALLMVVALSGLVVGIIVALWVLAPVAGIVVLHLIKNRQ